jgi:cytochrome c oxidase subunit 1
VVVSVLFIGSIFTPWAVVWAALPVAAALTAWFWPKAREVRASVALERSP